MGSTGPLVDYTATQPWVPGGTTAPRRGHWELGAAVEFLAKLSGWGGNFVGEQPVEILQRYSSCIYLGRC